MKKRTISIRTIKNVKAVEFTKNILSQEDQIKVKGGANPWLE